MPGVARSDGPEVVGGGEGEGGGRGGGEGEGALQSEGECQGVEERLFRVEGLGTRAGNLLSVCGGGVRARSCFRLK